MAFAGGLTRVLKGAPETASPCLAGPSLKDKKIIATANKFKTTVIFF